MQRQTEIPPTAGLPLRWRDLLPRRPRLTTRAASFLGCEDTLLTCSGSAALVIALRALHAMAPSRRDVVMPGYTCPLVGLAVRRAGLEPKLCDTEHGGFGFDPRQLEATCNERTLAVLPTHLAGRIVDVTTTSHIAGNAGAFVVEDAAQALGARVGEESVGMQGDVGFFSLAAGKGLSIFEGGLLVSRRPDVRRAVGEVHQPRRLDWELRRSAELLGYTALYHPRGLRRAYGDPLRRALSRGELVKAVGDDMPDGLPFHRVGRWRNGVGSSAIDRLPAFLAACNHRAARRLPRLRAIHGVHVFGDGPGQHGTWPYFLLRLCDRATRDLAMDALWTGGQGVSRLFIHAMADYPALGPIPGDVPNARDFAARSMTISNSPWLDDVTFESICRVLERVARARP